MSISTTPVHQDTGQITAGPSPGTVTLANAPTSGNVLIFTSGTAATTTPITSITQTNVSWTLVKKDSTTNLVEIWIGIVSGVGGTSLSIAFSGTFANTINIIVSEWSGIVTSSAANATDVTGSNTGTSATLDTGTITPTSGLNELFIGIFRKSGSFSTGPTNSWTNLTTPNAGFQTAYKVVASTSGTDSTQETWSTNTAWNTIYATFKGSAGSVTQKALAITQAETVSLKRNVGKIVALTSAEAFVLNRAISKIITAITSPQVLILKRASSKLISAPLGETVTLVETAQRPKTITIQSPETVSLIARLAKLQLIQVTQVQALSLVRAISHVVAVLQGQAVLLRRLIGHAIISILSGENVSVLTLRNKVIALTQAQLITLVRSISRRIQLRDLQILHVTRNLTHSIAVLQAQTVRLVRKTGKIIQLYMGQIVVAASHGFTPDSPLQVLKNAIERVRSLNNQIQRIRALKNSIKRRP